ncbi:MAG: hypothetical protein QNJ94_13185 [Alphaproteobacteria bacterium]|nr:hypothetical protein [Alphaproteobacteria bacterium]
MVGAALLAMALAGWPMAATAGISAGPGEIARAAEQALSDPAIQRTLPSADAPAEITAPRPQRDRSPVSPPSVDVSGLSAIGEALIWVMLGVALVLLLFYLARVMSARQGSAEDASEVDAASESAESPAAAAPLPPVEEADQLARAGRYGEAVRILLRLSVRALTQWRDAAFAASLTSREIAGHKVVPEAARSILQMLVAAVELSHFGGRELDADLYQRCRESYEQLARMLVNPA